MNELYMQYKSKYAEHSKENELQADSFALLLIRNAGYDLQGGVSMLQKLDKSDNILFEQSLDFDSFFQTKDMLFDKAWMQWEEKGLDTVKGNISRSLPDSLKTHPDCDIRSEILLKLMKHQSIVHKSLLPISEDLKKQIVLELISHFSALKRYDLNLYYSMQLNNLHPSNLYLVSNIANCLYSLCEAQRDHTYSNSVYFASPYLPDSFNKLLNILNNIPYSSLVAITKEYYKEHESQIISEGSFPELTDKINSLK